jgi:hypothetical protein
MSALFKDLTAGASVYALMKGDELKYTEGSIVSVGAQRVDVPQVQAGQMPLAMPSVRNVVDVTYSLDGKNYTDVVDVTASMFPTEKTGCVTLVSTDKNDVVRELQATLKKSENYLTEAEKMIPKEEKRVKECKALIAKLDTAFQEKQQTEERFAKIEESQNVLGRKLDMILEKLGKV